MAIMSVSPAGAQPLLRISAPGSVPVQSGGASFGQVLQRALDQLEQTQLHSDALAQAYAVGEDIEIHDLMIALQQTEIAFDLAVQVRNKVVDAYQEIMRMQI